MSSRVIGEFVRFCAVSCSFFCEVFCDGLRPGEAHVTLCSALLCDTCSNIHCSCSLVLIFQAGFRVIPRVERPRCGEQDVVRYLASDCVLTVFQVVVLNSCVDRLAFVVGEWRDRGTTEAIVLVVFCLLFFGTNSASHVTSGSPSLWF